MYTYGECRTITVKAYSWATFGCVTLVPSIEVVCDRSLYIKTYKEQASQTQPSQQSTTHLNSQPDSCRYRQLADPAHCFFFCAACCHVCTKLTTIRCTAQAWLMKIWSFVSCLFNNTCHCIVAPDAGNIYQNIIIFQVKTNSDSSSYCFLFSGHKSPFLTDSSNLSQIDENHPAFWSNDVCLMQQSHYKPLISFDYRV